MGLNLNLILFSYSLLGRCVGLLVSKSSSDWTFTLHTSTNKSSTDLSDANPSARTVMIIHGWKQNGNLRWIGLMKDAYLSRYPMNVIVLDWSSHAKAAYGVAARAVPKVGEHVAERIYEWEGGGLVDPISLKVIGFSLGAQIAGHAGQHYRKLTNGTKLRNIVGIEAAGPSFEARGHHQRLDASDALMVQAIHTSTTGMTARYGRVDVYFNANAGGCGKQQPACRGDPGVPIDSPMGMTLCNHLRAVAYFIESIGSVDFLAAPCSCSTFRNRRCEMERVVVVGEHLEPAAEDGAYHLVTSCKSPFALGAAGLNPSAYKC
ncbi:hypothetical protein PPYR_02802 [Photinus pyralis]|uniref:Lipase domain-containing protein n=2 Tax=Photinus pyralis TaxID=7054 RepID=A0A5N4A101_PHOPY|nr:hepatic triacylglycerol lipase-like [Photinus pyralis]XP_031330931.1 hepatic triacylglycerol lipase-like [Photinus pyralis]KAB0791002.1 hypothetical protein PPYR_02802 [Photinus pyralis]